MAELLHVVKISYSDLDVTNERNDAIS